jgi:hypothetical protein
MTQVYWFRQLAEIYCGPRPWRRAPLSGVSSDCPLALSECGVRSLGLPGSPPPSTPLELWTGLLCKARELLSGFFTSLCRLSSTRCLPG